VGERVEMHKQLVVHHNLQVQWSILVRSLIWIVTLAICTQGQGGLGSAEMTQWLLVHCMCRCNGPILL
jgi:hypothetical protein